MKTILTLLLIAGLAFAGPGCASRGETPRAFVNTVLDALLPPEFTGNVFQEHTNAYFEYTVLGGNFRRTVNGWTYSWLIIKRKGFVSRGTTRLGDIPEKYLFP